MSVILTATTGPSKGLKITVPRGQIARVGRTKWADYSIPDDDALADVQFAVDYQSSACWIRDFGGPPATDGLRGTSVNGTKIAEARIHSGDQVMAGKTTFFVMVEGEPLPVVEQAVVEPVETESEIGKARGYCAPLAMSAGAKELLRNQQEPEDYLDLLIAGSLFLDGLRFVAAWLSKPLAVLWGVQCVESVIGDTFDAKKASAMKSARAWAQDPTEANRRAAETAAESTGNSGPAGFLALSAFWSGGSLTPAGMEVVPPDEGLTAQGVMASIQMAACQRQPTQANARYRKFLEDGKKLALAQPKIEEKKMGGE